MTTRSQSKKTKTPSGRFECDSCSKTFAWKKDLYRHEKYHEPNTKKFPCPHCDRRFIRKDKLTSHLVVHLPGITTAPFLRSVQYFAHRLFSDKKFQQLKCMICNFSKAANVQELREHITAHTKLDLHEFLKKSEIVKSFYPDKDVKEVVPLIVSQIKDNQLGKLHSIINAHRIEMGISDSDGSDPESTTDYICELCDEAFSRKHKAMTHQAYEHTLDECPYTCEKCNLKFTCKQVYNSHLKHHCENPDKRFACQRCPARFTWEKNLENHRCSKRASANPSNTTCEVCNRVFVWPRDLKNHKKSHTQAEKTHDCSECGEKFVRSEELRNHMKVHKKKKFVFLEKKLMCMLCQAEFLSIRSLKYHLFTHCDGHTDVNFKNCGFVQNFFPDASEATVSECIRNCFNEQRLWQLYIAVNKLGLEMVLSDSDSEDEQSAGAPAEAYVCELCDVKFPRMQAILLHQHTEHDAEKSSLPYKCDKCDDQFVCEPLLMRHVKSECSNIAKLSCTKCGLKFIWKQNLANHNCLRNENRHDDKKCEVCGKRFIWVKDLHRHKRSHIPDEKKFECLVCGRKFNRKDNMRAHMKVHSDDYKAREKELVKWDQQDENMCRPHGKKNIQCKICLSKHDSIKNLTNHLMTHKNPATIMQTESEVTEISTLLYNKPMDQQTLEKAICSDLADAKYSRFYSITNEMGYELSLIDSETCTDLDADTDDDDEDGAPKGYRCKLCNKTFNRKFKIFDHQRQNHAWDELPLECIHCSAKFVCDNLYSLHLQSECENIEKQFKCKQCPLQFVWKENLKSHEKHKHDKNPVLPKNHHCAECDKSFLWLKDLQRHKKCHQSEEEKFECTWCFRVFMRRDNLKVHMKVHQNATHLLLPDIYYLARPNGTKIAECKHCDQKYSAAHQLLDHIQNTHFKFQAHIITSPDPTSYSITNALGYEMDIDDSETEKEEPLEKYFCGLCDARFNRRFKILQHQQQLHYSDNIPHKCSECSFKSVSEAVLRYHMRTQCMNQAKQFRCRKCTMRFMWQENLENHESLIHDSPRMHTCDVCKRDFATQHELKNHSDCKPVAEIKIFECAICERKYSRKDRLMRHAKLHVAEKKEPQVKTTSTDKKFLCAFCGKEVSSSSNLVIHMRRHTGEKPFKCEFCNKGFPRSSDLSCHRRTHTGERPHKCSVCDKAFSRSYKLQTHMRIHSGERPYKCTYCEKSFTQSNDLTLHVRRHTGERPYICETCGERFIQGTALKNHRRMRGHYVV